MSKKNKTKTCLHLHLSSEPAMIGAFNRYAELRIDVERRTKKHEKTVAELNSEFDEAIQKDREELAALETSLQLFAQNNRKEFFTEPKSRAYANGSLGFRTSPPSVERCVEKEKWDLIAERVEELPWGEPYVKEGKTTLHKDAILRDRDKLTEAQLAEAGLKIVQDETFFIQINAQDSERHVAETTPTVAAA